jgi:hypothetical protein
MIVDMRDSISTITVFGGRFEGKDEELDSRPAE